MFNLRFSADYRCLFYAFILFPGVPAAIYIWPSLIGWLLPLSLYLSYCSGIFAHNHNHCPTFKSKRQNELFSAWLSIFYGYPLFVWIPTHNLNHHKLVNRAGDATITWRFSKKHTLPVAIAYIFVSAYHQSPSVAEYVAKAKTGSPRVYRQVVTQATAVIVAQASMLLLALYLWGFGTGVLVYLFAFGIPVVFASASMIFTNYIQHVHCDPWSPDNHSRNFVSKLDNWFTFQAGYHTVHHEHPGTHWSKYPQLHAQRADRIHPALNEHSIFTFCIKNYVLGLFSKKFRTYQVGRAAYEAPPAKLSTDSVSPVEAGVNAEMA